MRYAVVIERSDGGYGACAPDLPGCGVVAETAEEAEALLREALVFHVEGLRERGEPVPEPSTVCKYVETGAS